MSAPKKEKRLHFWLYVVNQRKRSTKKNVLVLFCIVALTLLLFHVAMSLPSAPVARQAVPSSEHVTTRSLVGWKKEKRKKEEEEEGGRRRRARKKNSENKIPKQIIKYKK